VLWALPGPQQTIHDAAKYIVSAGAVKVVTHRYLDAYGSGGSWSNFEGASYDGGLFMYTGRFIDQLTGLQWHLHRWYDPALGRWLSEDPTGFAGDPWNLYRYVGNSPTNRIDSNGFEWTVNRTGQDWAIAEATSDADTIYDLAKKIKLNSSEFNKWLKATDGKPLPLSDVQLGLRHRCLAVPNRVEIYRARTAWHDPVALYGIIYRWNVGVTRAKATLLSRGFKVEDVTGDSKVLFQKIWERDGIYAFIFVGHSALEWDRGIKYLYPAVVTGTYGNIVYPSEVSPPYKLSMVAMFACGSAVRSNGQAWANHKSTLGKFLGYTGLVNVVNHDAQEVVE
jgi:RHS repeat-associated protein